LFRKLDKENGQHNSLTLIIIDFLPQHDY